MISPSNLKRKYTRRVNLTASDISFAKLINKPLEEVVKDKIRKRGRPSKNNPPEICPTPSEFVRPFKHLATNSQQKIIIDLNRKIEQYRAVIDYLETKLGLPR